MRRLEVVAVVAALMSSSARAETLEWIEQFGTSGYDNGSGVSADGLGSVYISGSTEGSLRGTNAGGMDAFLAKYDASGTLQWTQQLGTSERDWGNGVSADGLGSVYVSGTTDFDAFVGKYDASGMLEWTQQLGTGTEDDAVSADGLGNVYIAGDTWGNLEGTNAGLSDAFLAKYDASGTLKWTQQFGAIGWDRCKSVSADGLGSVYIAGWLDRDLGGTGGGYEHPGLGGDGYLAKYDDANGTLEWIQYFGDVRKIRLSSVSADGLGNVYISGSTAGDLGGPNAGADDTFVSKYDASGTLLWTQQFGTSNHDKSLGVSADGLDRVYISGYTRGSLGGPNAGYWDAFVAKITEPLLGDVNLDGEVNGLDVDPFVEVLLNGSYQQEADMNEDQVVNGLDVDSFVAAVVGDAQQIPEPSTLLLALIALGAVGGWRKWGG